MSDHGYALTILQLRLDADRKELDLIQRRLDRAVAPSENPLDCCCSFSTKRAPGQGTTTTRHERPGGCPVHNPTAGYGVFKLAVAQQQGWVDKLEASMSTLRGSD